MFEKTVLPIIEKIGIYSIEMQKSTIAGSRIVYSDIYQAIVKLDKINEDSHQFHDIDKNDEADADGKLKIWVDDVRPAPSGYMWVKSVNEFVDVVEHAGLESVEVVDIDHDAGDFYHDGGDYIRILDYLEFLNAKDV